MVSSTSPLFRNGSLPNVRLLLLGGTRRSGMLNIGDRPKGMGGWEEARSIFVLHRCPYALFHSFLRC